MNRSTFNYSTRPVKVCTSQLNKLYKLAEHKYLQNPPLSTTDFRLKTSPPSILSTATFALKFTAERFCPHYAMVFTH